jgi:hypothetical protein
MFKNTFQSGFLSILYSIGSKPLQIWDKQVRNGHIKRITDQDIQSSVLEIMGTNVSTNHITCPADKNKTLGIKLPFLVMIIKNVSPAPSAAASRPRVTGGLAARPHTPIRPVLIPSVRGAWRARRAQSGECVLWVRGATPAGIRRSAGSAACLLRLI